MAAWIALGALMSAPAQAAGGHHAVDDATMLDPGRCQVETWFEQGDGGAHQLQHMGPACRIGGLEWGFNVDRSREHDGARRHGVGPQVKWAVALNDQVAIGAAAASTWHISPTRYTGTTLLVPLTWTPTRTLAVHLNLGRDLLPGQKDLTRRGAAVEWTPSARWSFVAERFDDSGERHARLGVRWFLRDGVSIDLSRARFLGGDARAWTTLGLNWEFGVGPAGGSGR